MCGFGIWRAGGLKCGHPKPIQDFGVPLVLYLGIWWFVATWNALSQQWHEKCIGCVTMSS